MTRENVTVGNRSCNAPPLLHRAIVSLPPPPASKNPARDNRSSDVALPHRARLTITPPSSPRDLHGWPSERSCRAIVNAGPTLLQILPASRNRASSSIPLSPDATNTTTTTSKARKNDAAAAAVGNRSYNTATIPRSHRSPPPSFFLPDSLVIAALLPRYCIRTRTATPLLPSRRVA